MKKNLFCRTMAFLVVLALLLTGCTAGESETTAADTSMTTVPGETTVPPDQTVAEQTETALKFFSMNLIQTQQENNYLMAYPNEDGTVYVEYMGDVKKVDSNMDKAALDSIAATLVQTALADLNGQSVYEEGEATGSIYAEFADGTILAADYTGAIPQEYLDAYKAMDTCFQTLMADVEVYVPKPAVMGEVDRAALAELEQILAVSAMEYLDAFQISDVPRDNSFAYVMGLSSADGVAVGTNCSAMMMTTPYSLAVATLDDGGDPAAIKADFLDQLDWTKWVCVIPTDALVAQKGNMVLCLMGADDMFRQTADAIVACGWENVEEVHNPDM